MVDGQISLKNHMNLHYSQTPGDFRIQVNTLKNYMNLHYSQTPATAEAAQYSA